jgi:hypothetical protein
MTIEKITWCGLKLDEAEGVAWYLFEMHIIRDATDVAVRDSRKCSYGFLSLLSLFITLEVRSEIKCRRKVLLSLSGRSDWALST